MRFFQNPRFSAANGAITMTFFALFGSMFLMTQYWQLVHGYSPLGAGVRLIPYALAMMIIAPLSARLVERFGTKRVITAGLLVIAAALYALSFIHATTPYPRVITVFCLMAVGMGMAMAPATESVMGSLPREKAGVGSAVNDTTRQVGGALGVADHRQRRHQRLRQPGRPRSAASIGVTGAHAGPAHARRSPTRSTSAGRCPTASPAATTSRA